MPIPVKIKAASELIGETVVAEVLASWSIEEIKQLLNEVEAELRKRPMLARADGVAHVMQAIEESHQSLSASS
jgi:hypothetical protein